MHDDFVHLDSLQLIGHDVNQKSVIDYLNAADAGPTGRPVAMLSFLLDDTDWPSFGNEFKRTNLLIHLVNGLLLYWLLTLITRTVAEPNAWAVTAIATIWLLSPFHVSTVMYVIQRMTLLAATLVLLACITYLKGRAIWLERRKLATGLIVLSYGFAGIGLFAKESAAAFVLFVFLTEATLFRSAGHRSQFLRIATLLPVVALVVLLISNIPTYQASYDNLRDFTLAERLFSQLRAVGYYLTSYLIPNTTYFGVFTDGFSKSESVIFPLSTLLWGMVHIAIVGVGWLLRRKLPLLSLAIALFYAGHLLESTVVPLELLYEHRNYLPSAFLGLALMPWVNRRWFAAVVLLLVAVNTVFLVYRSEIWSGPGSHHYHATRNNPNSERASANFGRLLWLAGRHDQAVDQTASFMATERAGLDSAMSLLRMKCQLRQDTRADVDAALLLLERKRIRGDDLYNHVVELSRMIQMDQCQNLQFSDLHEIVGTAREIRPRYQLGLQSLHSADALLYLRAGHMQAFHATALTALRAAPNRELTINLCLGVIRHVSREKGCACLHEFRGYFESPPPPTTLIQRLLDKDGAITTRYEQIVSAQCLSDNLP